MKLPGSSVYKICLKLGMTEPAARKWLNLEKLEPLRIVTRKSGREDRYYDEEKAIAILKPHCGGRRANTENVDPDSGMSYTQLKMKEDWVKRKRENEIEEALKTKTWIEVTQHHQVLSTLTDKLDRLPLKCKSELGLTDLQAAGIQRIIDDIRKEASEEVKKSAK